jgi:GntR family transcriptional regulator, transcriptional repressor for pyruvate dehydrogenase complex
MDHRTTRPSRDASLFEAVSRPTLYVEVARKIRAAILDGTISSGQQLPSERELARQFGVSRASVREGLRHLQAEGFLAQGGRTSPLQSASSEQAASSFREALTRVVQLQGVSLGDLVELRVAIEGAALIRAAASPISEHIEEAGTALAIMERAETSPEEFRQADVAFHLALVAAGGNKALLLVMGAVKEAVRTHLDDQLSTRTLSKVRPRILAEHRTMLRSVQRGAGQAAGAQLRRHLQEFYGT